MQRKQFIPVIDSSSLSQVNAKIEDDLALKLKKINTINEIIIYVNECIINSYDLKELPFIVRLKKMKEAEGKIDPSSLRAMVKLNERKQFIAILREEKINDKDRLRVALKNKFTNNTNLEYKLEQFENVYGHFATYSSLAHLHAQELAGIAHMIDGAIFLINDIKKTFVNEQFQLEIEAQLKIIYRTRKIIALCMSKFVETNDNNKMLHNDIVWDFAQQMNALFGIQAFQFGVEEIIDNSFKARMKNPFVDKNSEFDITVEQYFIQYKEITLSNNLDDAIKAERSFALPKKQTDISVNAFDWLVPSFLTPNKESTAFLAKNLLFVPNLIIDNIFQPVFSLVTSPVTTITGVFDNLKMFLDEAKKQVIQSADFITDNTSNLIDGIVDKLKSESPVSAKIDDKPIAELPLVENRVEEVTVAPIIKILLNEEIKNLIQKNIRALQKEINFWNGFCGLFGKKVAMKKQKKMALQRIFAADDLAQAQLIANEYVHDEMICDQHSRTQQAIANVLKNKF